MWKKYVFLFVGQNILTFAKSFCFFFFLNFWRFLCRSLVIIVTHKKSAAAHISISNRTRIHSSTSATRQVGSASTPIASQNTQRYLALIYRKGL